MTLPKGYTAHSVLAGAYKGIRSNLDTLLIHASADQGHTAVCGKVADGNLCDVQESSPVTCAACERMVERAETFEQATARGAILSAKVDRTGAALKALSGGGPMGLTPDAAKTPEWHAAKRAHNEAFAALRAFNANYVKQFKVELRAARRQTGRLP